MDATELTQLETLLVQFYEGRDPVQLQKAQQVLLNFGSQPNCIEKCRQILDQSKSPYANALAASTLTKTISKPSCPILVQERVQIRNYALEYLATRLPLPHFVVVELARLICRIVKIGWFDVDGKDDFVMRDLPDEIGKFLSGTVPHCIVGMQLFEHLVEEMNRSNVELGLTKHRKIMTSFRDNSLFKIFKLTLDVSFKLADNKIVCPDAAMAASLAERVLSLGHLCLSFDFLGTNSDESTDDTRTAQIPTSWRDTVSNPDTMGVYFRMYMTQPAPQSALAMTCLVQLASARRTLFTQEQRTTYLTQLVHYVIEIFRSQHGLSDPDNYHEFCRLLARLKTNFQLSELVAVDGYSECINLAAQFTVASLSAWKWANNSLHYLLALWDRLISSIPYVKSDKPHGLEQYSPKISETYIQSRVSSVEVVLREGLDNPLEDIENLEIQMKQISIIARCQFEHSCKFLVSLFDPIAAAYTGMLANGSHRLPAQQSQFALLDGQLTWLVFILGAVIGTRLQSSPSESYDALDAELICRALNLMRMVDEHLAVSGVMGSEQLQVAILNFLQHFRLSFIGDTVPRHGLLYKRLSETIGIDDESRILDVLVNKIETNLKCYTRSDLIISKTLQLLSDLCLGYTSLRRLIKSDRVKFMLEHHTAQHFPFLDQCSDTRHRTTFYSALGRIMSSETTENDSSRFERFLAPLGTVMSALKAQLAVGMSVRGNVAVKNALRGAVRDIRGILQSLISKPSFSIMFEWLYPDYMSVLINSVQIWFDDPTIAVPILKCMAEFVTNKNNRLQMHTSSPNGILLFRETSKILVAYGERIITLQNIDPGHVYAIKYKGITVCFSMFKAALLGDYVNFGVFKLYGDDALDTAFGIFFKLLVSIPIADLLEHPKLCKSYYALLAAITRDHLTYLANLDVGFFCFFCQSILEGIKSVDVQICTQCCTALDFLLTYIIIGMSKSKTDESAQALSRHFSNNTDFLNETLLYLLNLVMFEDCKNQWSVSRPLLGLIIIQPNIFQQAQRHIIAGLPVHKHAPVADCFGKLMVDVEGTLSTKNRDKFTQNLAAFRRDINNFAKSAANVGAADGSKGGKSGGDVMMS